MKNRYRKGVNTMDLDLTTIEELESKVAPESTAGFLE